MTEAPAFGNHCAQAIGQTHRWRVFYSKGLLPTTVRDGIHAATPAPQTYRRRLKTMLRQPLRLPYFTPTGLFMASETCKMPA